MRGARSYFDWHAMLMAVSLMALAHGALNNWGQYAFKYMRDLSVASDAVVLDTGIFAVLIVEAVLVWRSAGY